MMTPSSSRGPDAVGERLVELVIFDCDGVLVDSERITNTVFAAMLAELGVHLSLAEMFEQFVGRSMTQCLGIMEAMLGGPPPPGFTDAFRERTRIALERDLRSVRGIEQALASLDAMGIPFCVASSGDHAKLRTTLGVTGLLPRFEGHIFSVTDVARGKPDPDVYLHAAERMGVLPSRTVVVEDTPIGTRAGVAAGMTVFGYAELTDPEQLTAAGATLAFRDMHDLPRLVAESKRAVS